MWHNQQSVGFMSRPRRANVDLMKMLPKSIRKELLALAKRPDSSIDYSDIPETQRSDWAGAVRGKFFQPLKRRKARHN
jgi:hypothetical protein